MPYTQNPRDFESPRSDVAVFFKKLMSKWKSYKRDHLYSFIDIDGAKRSPCIALRCGTEEVTLGTKPIFLLREALREDPNLLDYYLDGWLLTNADEHVAKSSSSGSEKPKRRLGAKPKSTFVKPIVAKVTNCDQQVVSNISDAVDSALG